MNHTYQPSLINKSQCGLCKYDFVSHTKFAHCESCPNIGECDFIESSPRILMCAVCQLREQEIQAELINRSIGPKPTPDNARLNELSEIGYVELQNAIANAEQPNSDGSFNSSSVSQLSNSDRVVELTNKLSKELPVDARSFHVKEVTSIVCIESQLAESIPDKDERAFKLAELVSERLESFKKNLFEVKKLEAELRVDMITDQRYLNLLVPSLRAAEREKFKSYDLTYQPIIKSRISPESQPKVRMTASDKAFESFAKMMGISVEQAKKAMTSVLNEKGIVCSCQETPGLCKVHPS